SKTYQKLAKNRAVLDKAIADLQLPMDADALGGQITAEADGETQLLSIGVSDTDPARAAAIATAVAQRFQTYVVDHLHTTATAARPALGTDSRRLEHQTPAARPQITALPRRRTSLVTRKTQSDLISDAVVRLQSTYGRIRTRAAARRGNPAF